MDYKVIDLSAYYRKGVWRHFTEDCRCSVSMTVRLDVTRLAEWSEKSQTKFYINFLWLLCLVLNSREDFRMGWKRDTGQLICWDRIHPLQYVFHPETGTCTPVYTRWQEDWSAFYGECSQDLDRAKREGGYHLEPDTHPNWFDASYLPWVSYDALNIELPDGYPYYAPIVNWCHWREDAGRLVMPVTIRLNHAVADGWLLSLAFRKLQEGLSGFPSIVHHKLNK